MLVVHLWATAHIVIASRTLRPDLEMKERIG
jgi:hypothetical protein